MKKLLTLLLLIPALCQGQKLALVDSSFLQKALAIKIDVVGTIADLKAKPVTNADIVVLVQGKATATDGNGAFYKWMALSTDAEDMTFLNVVTSTLTGTGRWVRLNVKNIQLPQGVLSMNNGVKTLYVSGATSSSSTTTTYLTYDGTPTGTPIFSSIFYNAAQATVNVVNLVDAVSSCVKSVSTDKKVTVHQFWKGNNTVISLLGTLAQSFANAPTGTPVQIKVEGI
jgi:hypothetical protein